MQTQGIEFGFHTQDHYNLKNCTPAELSQQLDDSDVRALTNTRTFAYPFGYFTDSAVSSLTEQGYERIMTVGNNNRRYSALHLDRTEVFSADPAVLFAELEVVEPIIGILRKLASLFEGKKASTAANIRTNVETDSDAEVDATASSDISSTSSRENRAA